MNTSTCVNEYLSPKYYNMSTRAVQRQVRVSLNGGADSAGVMEERWGEKGKRERARVRQDETRRVVR